MSALLPVKRRQVFPILLAASAVNRGIAFQSTSAEPESKYLTVNGVKLHYLEWGRKGARPMLLLHPAPLNSRVWQAFGPAMARDFHVVAPDARGFGDSQWSTYEGDVFVDDLHALIAALGFKRVVLCGNSMGGTLGFIYAALHPDQVERLILVDTGPGEKPDPGAAAPSGGARPSGPPPIPPGPFASVEEAAAKIPRPLGPAFAKAMVDSNLKQDADGSWRWKYDYKGTGEAAIRSMRDPRKWGFWTAVQCPTLVLRGGKSPAMSQRAAEQMVAENRNAALVVIENAGHFVPIEEPAAFETAVRKWLGK